MKRKQYTRPEVLTVELKQRTMILAGSTDQYGMERQIVIYEEVPEGW